MEAVINYGFQKPIDQATIAKIAEKLRDEYPVALQTADVDISYDPNTNHLNVNQISGLKLTTDDQANVALVGSQHVVTSRLAPYDGWEALTQRSRRTLDAALRCTREKLVSRIGVRYINRIDIPEDGNGQCNPYHYVSLAPPNPKAQFLAGVTFSSTVTFITKANHWLCNVNCARVIPAPLIGHLSVIVDIDVYRTEKIGPGLGTIMEITDEARQLKDDIFESCITDQARALFS